MEGLVGGSVGRCPKRVSLERVLMLVCTTLSVVCDLHERGQYAGSSHARCVNRCHAAGPGKTEASTRSQKVLLGCRIRVQTVATEPDAWVWVGRGGFRVDATAPGEEGAPASAEAGSPGSLYGAVIQLARDSQLPGPPLSAGSGARALAGCATGVTSTQVGACFGGGAAVLAARLHAGSQSERGCRAMRGALRRLPPRLRQAETQGGFQRRVQHCQSCRRCGGAASGGGAPTPQTH